MKYQKKPVVIDAWKTNLNFPNLGLEISNDVLPVLHPDGQWTIWDKLHDTEVKFEPGDWIIKGLKGEFYPCKPDVFEASYELVQE